jgi:hypothetical protein
VHVKVVGKDKAYLKYGKDGILFGVVINKRQMKRA